MAVQCDPEVAEDICNYCREREIELFACRIACIYAKFASIESDVDVEWLKRELGADASLLGHLLRCKKVPLNALLFKLCSLLLDAATTLYECR